MTFNELTDEQKAKARAYTSTEELLALVEAEGVELNDEQLEGISGGWNSSSCSDDCLYHDCTYFTMP